MKIIIPMAGMGKRMRPHTLTIPKPLIPLAGKPIVERLVEDIIKASGQKVEEIAFVIGDFGPEVEKELVSIAENHGAKGIINYQKEPLGTAHAIYCASQSLDGNVIIAFADTLFKTDFVIDPEKDGTIWVQKIDDPTAFGVVKVNNEGYITDFVEKPETFVSDLAIIGVYYIRDGKALKNEIKYLLDNNIRDKGEFQLTNALENLKAKGFKFTPGQVDEWLDCGNKDATVYTNQRVLEFNKDTKLISESCGLDHSVIIEPCYIGDNVKILNSVVGPHVSIGAGSIIQNSIIKNSIIQESAVVKNKVLSNCMLGNHTESVGTPEDLSLGDYSTNKC